MGTAPPIYNDARKSVAARNAAALGAELHLPGSSGEGVARNEDGSTTATFPSLYARTLPNAEGAWNFASFPPDAVVVSLDGADANGACPSSFAASYRQQVLDIRTRHGTATSVFRVVSSQHKDFNGVRRGIAGALDLVLSQRRAGEDTFKVVLPEAPDGPKQAVSTTRASNITQRWPRCRRDVPEPSESATFGSMRQARFHGASLWRHRCLSAIVAGAAVLATASLSCRPTVPASSLRASRDACEDDSPAGLVATEHGCDRGRRQCCVTLAAVYGFSSELKEQRHRWLEFTTRACRLGAEGMCRRLRTNHFDSPSQGSVRLRFTGNQLLSNENLEGSLRAGIDGATLRAAAETPGATARIILATLDAYADRGYLDAVVGRAEAASALEPPELRVYVEREGAAYTIGSIRLREVEGSGHEVSPLVPLEIRTSRGEQFARSFVKRQVQRLLRAYHDRGFCEADFASSPFRIDPERRVVDVVADLIRGPRCIVDHVAFTGVPGEMSATLTDYIPLKAGEVFTPTKLEHSTALLRDYGFSHPTVVFSAVTPQVAARERGRLHVIFEVTR